MAVRPHACTDVTGFGLLGHVNELAQGSGLTVELWGGHSVAGRGAGAGPGGDYPWRSLRNQGFPGREGGGGRRRALELADVLYDPQTAGGL